MLIQTETERIYRRSFRATYYIYTIASHKLARLSDGDKQQVPVWSSDGLQVAFVRDNNIFVVKLLYDNAEIQVTKDGKRNEVINGLPDWVNEEEFGFNRALTFNADGTMICWLRYDEKRVKTYSLQMYKGMDPEKTENALYPGYYEYKYPKAGEDNSLMSHGATTSSRTRFQSCRCRSMPTLHATHQDDKRPSACGGLHHESPSGPALSLQREPAQHRGAAHREGVGA